jgi:hypothetical protein
MAEKTNLTPSSYNYSMSHPFDAIDMFIPGKISKWACFLNYFLLNDTSLLTFPTVLSNSLFQVDPSESSTCLGKMAIYTYNFRATGSVPVVFNI